MWKGSFFHQHLLEDIKYLRQENGIEESIVTITRTLKRKMIDTFPEEISLYPHGKYLIVQSSNANPCQYILAVLNSKGLKVTSARKLFFTINQPLRCNEWIFFICRKNKILFSRFLGFCDIQTSKSVTLSQSLLHMRRYTFDCFF